MKTLLSLTIISLLIGCTAGNPAIPNHNTFNAAGYDSRGCAQSEAFRTSTCEK